MINNFRFTVYILENKEWKELSHGEIDKFKLTEEEDFNFPYDMSISYTKDFDHLPDLVAEDIDKNALALQRSNDDELEFTSGEYHFKLVKKPELRLTVAEFQIALNRFFGDISYEKYRQMCGGFGDISEEEWEFYNKFNYLLQDKIHPPFLEKMIEMYPRSMEVITGKDILDSDTIG